VDTSNSISPPVFGQRLNTLYGSSLYPTEIQRLIVRGIIPARQNAKGTRWLLDPADIPLVADRLGLTKSQNAA
jgi:hypothetical protein